MRPKSSPGVSGWLSFRFSLSYRAREAIMAERGVVLTEETVRQGCLKIGQTSANERCRRRPQPQDKWHVDEVVLKILGKRHSLWGAVDQHGKVFDLLGQNRREKRAANQFFRKLLKGLEDVPGVMITNQLANDAAAKRELLPGVEHPQHKGLTHRAENSPHPTRQRERARRRFTSSGHAQRFLSACGPPLKPCSSAQADDACRAIACHDAESIPGLQ